MNPPAPLLDVASGKAARQGVTGMDEGWRAAALLMIAVLGWLWVALLRQLGGEWLANAQFSFGWVVPLLAAMLFFRRWQCRPEPQPLDLRGTLVAGIVAVALALLPLRVIQEANSDWHLVSAAMAALVASLSLAVLAWMGGGRWARHFAFPILFIFSAVPWSDATEAWVSSALMRLVTTFTVETINLLGIAAAQHGNVIEIGTGLLGVEEACSGIKSLHAVLMVALFAGEYFGLRLWGRLALLALGVGLSFVSNAARAFSLVWINYHSGTAAMEGWHDRIGFWVLVACLAGVLFGARRFSPAPAPVLPVSRRNPLLPPCALMGCLLVWLGCVEALNEGWYRWHEHRAAQPIDWTVSWPAKAGFQEIPLTEKTAEALQCNTWEAAEWMEPDRSRWRAYYMRWLPGLAGSRLEMRVHNPTICLPAAGFQMKADFGIRQVAIQGVQLPLHAYLFDSPGGDLHVFFVVSEDHGPDDHASQRSEEWGRMRRLEMAWNGRRQIGHRAIELALRNFAGSPEEAQAAACAVLRESIHLSKRELSSTQ